VARISGDPGVGQWLRFALGFRLPEQYRDWVHHELTDAGWRSRATLRQSVLLLPVAAAFAALPGPVSLRVLIALLVLIGGLLVGLAYGDTLRAARLRQHGLPVPADPDLGRPTDDDRG
jgi:hypothetical protein